MIAELAVGYISHNLCIRATLEALGPNGTERTEKC